MEPIAEGVWGWTGEVRMPAGVRFPVRMTGVRLPDGSMWLHSPISLDDTDVRQLEALGPVRHLVAPSLIHTLFLAEARRRWPEARLYGVPGLRSKLPELPIDEDLGPHAPDAWQGALRPFPIEGAPGLNEVVFLHAPSRTLLVTDLVFNVLDPANLQTELMMWITGTRRALRSSRLWAWRFTEDRAAVAQSVRRVLEQDFERVVPCHGEIVTHDGQRALAQAVTPLL
jgi:hypothetical protein